MVTKARLLTLFAGGVFLSSVLIMPVILPVYAQQQNGHDMPGMQMPKEQGLHSQEGMKMPGEKMAGNDTQQDLPDGPAMKLNDLEQMALSRNPTLAQASADVRAAQGAKRQAGFYPNPTVGYYGDEIRGGGFRSGKEGAFVNQTIVLGGKLGAARQTAEQQRLQAVTNVDAQRYRVLNTVRGLYYQALAAQRLVQVRRQLLSLADDAVQTSHQLGNVGQADRPDVLQAEVEAEQAEIELDAARQDHESLWKTLAASVGNPELPFSRLEGSLEDFPKLDQQEWLSRTLTDSPQVKYAQQDTERAKAVLREAKKQPIPDLVISANISQDNEPLEPSRSRTGIVEGAQVGVQLPLFNHNQGNIEKAKADFERSQNEVQRVQLDLRRKASALFRDYTTAERTADRYRNSMLPRAQKAYELYKDNYQNMAAAYPQVLIAQRTLFQLQVDYIHALEAVQTNALQIQGYALSDGLAEPMAASGSSLTSGSGAMPAGR